jgi:hypothetical protein
MVWSNLAGRMRDRVWLTVRDGAQGVDLYNERSFGSRDRSSGVPQAFLPVRF